MELTLIALTHAANQLAVDVTILEKALIQRTILSGFGNTQSASLINIKLDTEQVS